MLPQHLENYKMETLICLFTQLKVNHSSWPYSLLPQEHDQEEEKRSN